MAHSELPPSSSDKWLACTGWRKLNASIPPGETSAAAQEGTDAHSTLAEVVEGRLSIDKVTDKVLSDAIGMLLNYVEATGADIHSEIRVDFGGKFGYVGLTGTSDLVLVHPEFIEVIDFKYGKQLVESHQNPQMLTYLVGAVNRFGSRPYYRITIAQPRADHFLGPIRSSDVSQEELDDFSSKVEVAVRDSYLKPKLTPGAHCRNYCNALSVCPAVRELVVKAFKDNNDE